MRIDAIQVGERRREDLGDIHKLAASIARYGLLHPVVVDEAGHLVAGERRLAACRMLGLVEVETHSLGDISEEELREIELEENLRRKDLTPAEQARVLAGRAAIAEQVLTQRSLDEATTDFPSDSDGKSRMGRPPKAVSRADVAQYLGVGEGSVSRAKAHVDAVERYPELEPLPQDRVLATAKTLDSLPEVAREPARDFIRKQARQEAIESTRLLEVAGVLDDPAVQRARVQAAYAKAVAAVWDKLLTLDADIVAGALDGEEAKRARIFIRDCRTWLDQLDTALSTGLRVVGGTD